MKTAVLFAGQGSQRAGMGKDMYEQYPEFREVFDLLTEEEKRAAFEGPEEELKKTQITQPVLLAFAAGAYAVLKSRVPAFAPDAAAGLSLGEYSALTAAGVFDTETALDIVRARGKAMAECAEGADTVMSAVIGAEREAVIGFVDQSAPAGIVEIANYNCPGQIVISGSEEGVSACEALIAESGSGRCVRLPVSGPFHTSYMEPASRVLEDMFKGISFGEPAFPVYANRTGLPGRGADKIRGLLVEQVKSSVMFEDTLKNMIEDGVDTFIEIGPGKTLSGFVKKTDRKKKTVVIDKAEDIEKAVELLTAEE